MYIWPWTVRARGGRRGRAAPGSASLQASQLPAPPRQALPGRSVCRRPAWFLLQLAECTAAAAMPQAVLRGLWSRVASASLRTVGAAAGLTVTASATTITVVAAYAANGVHAARRRGYTDSMVLTPEDLNMPYEEVQFFAADGVSLTGWHIPQSSQGRASRRVIVCCHPYNHSKSNLLGVARGFWEQRYSLFLFDFRSFAHQQTGQSIGFYEQRDARAAIACAKSVSPPDAQIGLMGASMGGAVSLIVGHEEETEAVGIIADCPFMSLRDVLEQAVHHEYPLLPTVFTQTIVELASWLNPVVCWCRGQDPYSYSDVSPVSAVATGDRAGQVPLLVLHAEDDEVCPVSHGYAIHAAATVPRDQKQLVVVQDCHHVGCFFKDRSAYMKMVVSFFDGAFEAAAAASANANAAAAAGANGSSSSSDGGGDIGDGGGVEGGGGQQQQRSSVLMPSDRPGVTTLVSR